MQGELLSNVVLNRLSRDEVNNAFSTSGDDGPAIETQAVPLAIVLTQSCDLVDDFRARPSVEVQLASLLGMENGPAKDEAQKQYSLASNDLLRNILLCEVFVAERVRYLFGENWKTVRQNDHKRYHFLCEVNQAEDLAGTGLPPLVIDMIRYFTIPAGELYKRLEPTCPARERARRRCTLAAPILEHLTSRFAYSLSRVALEYSHWEMTGMSHDGEVIEQAKQIGSAKPLAESEGDANAAS
ncbi:MAG: hypothetical protein K2Y39_21540 [Candidatus Obscuribacterales bacterium]|nr:hypothetical protein [Candidatus Obscuribacterales bacterium]